MVLLHGIARSSQSLSQLEEALTLQGYAVLNLDYPAREKPFEAIVEDIHPVIRDFVALHPGPVHFVTHSMGGLVARAYLNRHPPAQMGRVVMLAPPSQGSEVADFLATNPLYKHVFGPAGQQLVTAQDASLTALLGSIDYPVGVIAGNRSVNLISSWFLLPGEDDGKVTVARTKVDGMADFLVLPVTHPFLMANDEVIRQTVAFLRVGAFAH